MNDDLIHRSSHINRESLVHRSDGKPTDGAMCPWKTAGVDVTCPGTFAISYAHGPQIVASHSEDKKWLKYSETRQIRRELGSKEDCLSNINIRAEKLKDLQDTTLATVRELAALTGGTRGVFFKRDALLYRRWTPRRTGEEMEIEQLALPKKCRQVVLEMSHYIPIAEHPGRDRTRQRLLRRFFWPSIFSDIDKYCKSSST
ncbi:hypothetical protein EMCRGX_G021494 [Ephydatia muelleri]